MILHTEKFLENWKKILFKLYEYEEYMDFVVVPSLTKVKTLSYIPLLNYSNRESSDVLDLLELAKDNNYQIRTLNSNYKNFQESDTVTMRLDISSRDEDYVFSKIIKSKCRNQIRKSIKNNLHIKVGEEDLLDDFYALFKKTMHRYGTPVFSKDLFSLILKNVKAKLFIVYKDNKAISSLILICDEKLSIVPWAASDYEFVKYCPNHLMYHEAIKYSISQECDVFDFGRSGYLTSSTYKFKEQWGAKPVKIDLISSQEQNIYSKYSMASKVWKKLPSNVCSYIGPKLCKFLVDL